MREICTSGSVGGEGGNILAYPAEDCRRLVKQLTERLGGMRSMRRAERS
jgi:hypothetical protein